MNQTFRFKSFPSPGWLIPLLIPVIILYFGYVPTIFDALGLNFSQDNKFVVGILFLLPLYFIYYLVSYGVQAYLKTNSYLEINGEILNLIMLSKTKWNVPISAITQMDNTQGHRSVKSDFLKVALSRRASASLIGFNFVANNQIYEVKPILDNFENFKQTIISLNPNIKFEEVTAKANVDFYNMDLGKALQEKAPVLTGVGKFISKLNFVSAFIILLLIVLALITWLVLATN